VLYLCALSAESCSNGLYNPLLESSLPN